MSYLEKFYKKEFKTILKKYPRLTPSFDKGHWKLEGEVDVVDANGKIWDMYKIRIVFPKNYPKSVPTMYEIGGRLDPLPELHVNSDGSCCLAPAAQEMVILRGKVTILGFLDELVMPYLANQTYREKAGEYANGEFGHGALGIYEFYQEVFDTKNISFIVSAILKIVNKELPGRNELCFCNSGKKYKNCHLRSTKHLSPVSKTILIKDCQTLWDALNAAIQQNR